MPFTKACCLIKKNGIHPIYLDKEIVNTAHRKDYIVNDFIPKIEAFEKKLALIYAFRDALHQDAKCHEYHERNGLFIGVSLLLTSLIFFSFPFLQSYINRYYNCNYRVMWTFGLLGLFNFQITVLTAVVPT
jgi:hypothetical protein